ncbi:MAG: hypothetical protein AVDCRST_MAG51-2674 [uncultured Ramlibacter sp.]|uniref:Uncharacterized protein n=1 Tax=uncultured Ramlibacter sp. TaxID=260755 RepID=A0A6J4Q0Y5_9BURK|nr:MAG: hypothetical protein AVDCRST_MAG51-2674 [uncultured Ramlibacter sp.]
MSNRDTTPMSQQQQPPRDGVASQQQMAGSNEFQPKDQQPGAGGAGKPQQMGEGSYEGSRDYKERTERYLEKADVDKDADAAKPRSEEEARDLQKAEEEARSHSRGEH